jgi:hypothetical protein
MAKPGQPELIKSGQQNSLCCTGPPDQEKSYFAVGLLCSSEINLWISDYSRKSTEHRTKAARPSGAF